MKIAKLVISITVFLLVFFSAALAEEAKSLRWWEIATGILAIPAAVLGLHRQMLCAPAECS